MNEDRFADMTEILHLGLKQQDALAELNRVVTERIRTADYSRVHELFEELLAIAGEDDIKKMAQKEERLDGISDDLSGIRIGLLKEKELLAAMRDTNNAYIDALQQEIEAATAYMERPANREIPDVITRQDTLQKRVQELMTTHSVGVSFSAQIKLAEDNLASLSDRIWHVMVNLLPLLRGRISMEYSKVLVTEIQKMMQGNAATAQDAGTVTG